MQGKSHASSPRSETEGAGGVRRLKHRTGIVLLLAAFVFLLTTAVALAVTGDLTQPAGTAGCVSETGAGPCADGHALDGAGGVAVSSDGKSVYVTGQSNSPVARLNRNTTTGAITQPAGIPGCVSENGSGGTCADGHGLSSPTSVAVSPDGKSVYVTTAFGLARLNRNTTTGAISQPADTTGCINETGTGGCADGHQVQSARDVAVSPDGKSVYVAASDGVGRLVRNTTTGAISQPAGIPGCVSEDGTFGTCADGHGLVGASGVAVSADGKSVYVVAEASDAVVRLTRNTTNGAISQPAGIPGCVSETGAGPCANGHALDTPESVAVSADGKSVYVASSNSSAVARLNRNTTTGAIAQPAGIPGCVSEDGTGGTCANGHALIFVRDLAVSGDGKNVYVASGISDAVARLTRNTTSGAISQPAGIPGCVSETGVGPCANGHALVTPASVAVSANGRSVYVASTNSDAVARFNRAP